MESMAQGQGYSKEKLEIITVLLDEGEKPLDLYISS